jgi:PAS domain S-box-containing protein
MNERVRVLHVDDDPEFADLAATFLERERETFSVDTATDGQAGLAQLAGTGYDCIISDYEMPGMGGIEFLEAVRESHPELPFILFTGRGSEEVASEAISAGVTDYLQKGGTSEQYALLANRIENAVEATRTAERAARQEHLMHHAEVVGESGAWQADLRTGELHCTVGVRHILGVEVGEEPERLEAALEYYHHDSRAELQEMIEQVRASGEETAGELWLQRADGDRRLVEVTLNPIVADDEVVALRGAIHDITERNEREQQLREERRFIDQTLDALDELVYVVEPDGRLRRWNDAVGEVTGYSDDQIAGMDVTAFVAAADQTQIEGAVEAALSGGHATVTAELCTADGAQIPYRFTGSRLTDSTGEPTGVVGVGRRRDEQSRHPDPAGMVVQHTPDPAVLVDVSDSTTFHIEHVNPAYEELTGLDGDELCGRRPGAVFGGEFREHIDAQYRNCIEQQAVVEYTEHWPVDGESHVWETSVAPVIRNGTVVALVATKRDITSHSRREDTLEQYEQLVENLPVGVFRTTPDGEFVSMNEALVSMYDAGSRATLRTAGVECLYAEPSHRELLLDQLEEKGAVEDKLVRMETLGGDQLWAELSLSAVSEDGNRYIDGVVRDVTQQDRRTPVTEVFELLGDTATEPLFLVDVGEQLTLQHVDTTREDGSGSLTDSHGDEVTASDGGESAPTLEASQAETLRECIRTREPCAFDGVSPLSGNPVEGTARVVPVVVDGSVEYLVGLLDRS